jgi:hypothetical protein
MYREAGGKEGADKIKAAMAKAEDLAGTLRGPRDIARMAEEGGMVGRQVAGIAMGKRFKGTGGAKGTEKYLERFKELTGLDIESLAADDERFQEIMEDKRIGGKGKKGKQEIEDFQKILVDISKKMLTETKEGAKSHQEKLATALNAYTTANTRFVNAVNQALGDSGGTTLKEAQAELNASEDKVDNAARPK